MIPQNDRVIEYPIVVLLLYWDSTIFVHDSWPNATTLDNINLLYDFTRVCTENVSKKICNEQNTFIKYQYYKNIKQHKIIYFPSSVA